VERKLRALGWSGVEIPVYTFMMGTPIQQTKRKRDNPLPKIGSESTIGSSQTREEFIREALGESVTPAFNVRREIIDHKDN
jgi:hypothetical protein